MKPKKTNKIVMDKSTMKKIQSVVRHPMAKEVDCLDQACKDGSHMANMYKDQENE